MRTRGRHPNSLLSSDLTHINSHEHRIRQTCLNSALGRGAETRGSKSEGNSDSNQHRDRGDHRCQNGENRC